MCRSLIGIIIYTFNIVLDHGQKWTMHVLFFFSLSLSLNPFRSVAFIRNEYENEKVFQSILDDWNQYVWIMWCTDSIDAHLNFIFWKILSLNIDSKARLVFNFINGAKCFYDKIVYIFHWILFFNFFFVFFF